MQKEHILFIVIFWAISGCGFNEEETQSNITCPGWSFESQSQNLSGSIASSSNYGTFLISFEQDPIIEDIRAGTLVTPRPIALSKGKQNTEMTLQIQQTPLIWSSSTREDDAPVSYEAPQLTIQTINERFIIGNITGQARRINTSNTSTSIEKFELYFKTMAPGVEVPSDCYEASGRTEKCKSPNKKTNLETQQLECTYTCSRFKSKSRTKCFDLPRENCPATWTFDESEDQIDCK